MGAPVGVGEAVLVQVHQFAETFDLGPQGEVIGSGVVSGVLAGFREVLIDVPSRDFSEVFGIVINEDSDGVPVAMLLRGGDEFAALDHSAQC